MKKASIQTAAVCALLLGASHALAHSPAADGDIAIEGDAAAGYVVSGGNAIKTGGGECLKLGGFSEDSQSNACEGIVDEPEPEPEPVVKAPEPEPEPEPAPVARIDTRDLSGLALFEFDSDQLNSDGDAAMEALFAQLAEFKGITGIKVTGYTDSTGPEEYNQALSQRRAETIANVIKTRYPDASITAVGLGEADPVADNSTPEGRQQNRRVVIDLTASRMTFE